MGKRKSHQTSEWVVVSQHRRAGPASDTGDDEMAIANLNTSTPYVKVMGMIVASFDQLGINYLHDS